MAKSRIILFSIIVLTTLVYANPFSTYREYLGLSEAAKDTFYVVNPIQDRTMSRAMLIDDRDSIIVTDICNTYTYSADEYPALSDNSILSSWVTLSADLLDFLLFLEPKGNVGRTNVTFVAYGDSNLVVSASDTFNVAVENNLYQWSEGGSNYSFQPQHCVGRDSNSWKAAAHFSLGSESYILKEIEFGFLLPENIEWKIVEFNEVPIDTIIVGGYIDGYIDLLDTNPESPTYQVIDASFTETVLTGDIALVFSSEGNYMSLDPNGESSNTWIYTDGYGWALANSYTSAYDGAWYAGIRLEKIVDPIEMDRLNEGFETGTFELENWDTNWEVKHNTEADGGLNGDNLLDPSSNDTWIIDSLTHDMGPTYIHSGEYSAAIPYYSPDFNWLISPRMQLDYNDYYLNFWLWFKSSDHPTKFNVMVNDNINGWINLLSYDGSTPDNMYQSEVEVSLAGFVGKTIRIAFVTEKNDGNNVAVDDIRITSPTDIDYFKLPISIVLEQNYPNPFNPTTEINFTLNHNSFTKLRVFNSSGEVVKTLNDSKLAKGLHSFNFDGRDLNSGVYFYQLEVDGVRSTKKMLLIK